ncbi:MAG: putative metal-binding motif-containing protein, partial [Myxococcota bacterium]|nr:putative metal-binding motif-containing protein [Myxococcota bacterium]
MDVIATFKGAPKMRIAALMTGLALMGCRVKDAPIDDGSFNGEDSGIVTITDVDGDGYSAEEDCNDEDELLHPGASEICDGIDNNCDGEIDEGVSNTYYEDADEDGFGDAGSSIEACEAPEGYVPIGNDCNDADETSYPGAPEQCDGVDNDCDGEIDEDTNSIWYADADDDGFGDNDTLIKDCNPGPGYTIDDGDCDDADADINPDGIEVCDEADNDCDGGIDEGVTSTWYADTDGDSFGDADTETEGCDPGGYIETDGDCDDADADINPDAAEVCDGADNDCDGGIDEGVTSTWYADTDGDSF